MRFFTATIFTIQLCNLIHAQSDTSLKLINLNEVIISVNKVEEKKTDIPYDVEIIKSKDVELLNAQTSADMLQNTGKVFVQKSQAGGGSPVIRGFEANRVLLVVDGVRMNNAIYRSGHLQDIITIDNSMLERTEVVYGPSSVMYGSDALGGVVHFFTKKPLLGSKGRTKITANTYTRYSSANKENTAHLDFNIGFRRIGFLTSVTFSDFEDTKIGLNRYSLPKNFGNTYYYAERINGVDSMVKNSDPSVQKFTGYSQVDFMEKILFQQSNTVSHTLNLQYSSPSNIPRYDRLREYANGYLKFAEWNYGSQNRVFASYQNKLKSERKLFNLLTTTLAYQNIDQERITRRFGSDFRKTQKENVEVYTFNMDFNKSVNGIHQVRYGFEGTFNDVTSTASELNIVSRDVIPSDTRYPDGGSQMHSIAAYLTHKWNLSEKTILSEGLRYSRVGLSSTFTDTTFFLFPFKSVDQTTQALNGNIGLIVIPTHRLRFHFLGSTGFRSPNVDDMSKVFESIGSRLIVPNSNLKPEYTYNGEFGVSYTMSNKVQVEANYFFTFLNNAMVVKDAQYNGQDSIFFGGTMSKVQSLQNADEAYLQGISGNVLIDFSDHISLKSSINYTKGSYYDKQNDTLIPLDHIAPLYGQTALNFKFKKTEFTFYTQYNGAKRLQDYSPSGEDNLSQAPTTGIPAWATLNFKSTLHVNKYLFLNIGMENIFDINYRVFASGVSAPGRNLIVSLRCKF